MRRATHCLTPGRGLLFEAVMVVGGRASQADASDGRDRGIVTSVPERRLDGSPSLVKKPKGAGC